MKLYLVHRPYCSPSAVLVVAATKSQAVALARVACGHAGDETASQIELDGPKVVCSVRDHYYE